MKLVTLDSVLTFHRGITFKPDDKVEVGSSESVVCFRTKNIQKELDESDLLAVPSSFVKRDELYVNQGDILISTANSWELVGKCVRVVKTQYKSTIGGFISLLRPKSELIDPDYLFRFLSMDETQERIRHLGKKTTNISNLDRVRFLQLQIPLPPLETQKKIAAVLEKADQLRKDCKLLEQELNSLAQSVFIDMFGSKASGYSEWPLHRIEELAESKKGSMRTGPFGSDLKHSEFVDEGIAVIGIDNAVKNEFAWGERRFITPEKYEKLKRYRVYPQDLIITIMGTTGRIAVIPDDIPLSISTKHLAVITLDKDKVIPEFLATAIKTHPDLLHQIIDSNKGAIMDGLNLGLIKALSLRLPPLDLQLKYLAGLKVIRERIFESRSSHEQNNDLFNSLMQKAFKGELNL
ncbi:restriction endonuclease subunit S [Vibrio cholerae]|nr:restriction endonuclease subunit S [Vibrio cholerae]EGR1141120.1 restriction endonuclease subunit S [Vibrio cholerae]EGR2514152.1 restriction endonuclease subunit S [Vibrio cholerae]EGR2516786.1 restriction endonuclease subunit S [Vibrio cholerae]